MLTPSILSPCTPFYAIGNTPAVSLTRCVPQGVDADVLLLGCGDVRHILYTAYAEKGSPPRKLDVTCCDVEDAIIARNVLFLTLLSARGEALGPQLCWNLYYHLFLDDESIHALQEHLANLLDASVSSAAWKASDFGAQFRFSTDSTLSATRSVWEAYADAIANKNNKDYRARFEAALARSKQSKQGAPGSAILTSLGARAAAPLVVQASLDDELREALDTWWETGITGTATSGANVPNPLFSAALSEANVLGFGSDPILSYHLAAAKAHLAELSPLRPTISSPGLSSDNLVVRFVAADCFALCHTLQHNIQTGQPSSHFYRRQLSAEALILDADEYAKTSTPKVFDVIDTSNLSDIVGALNIIISASPLLKDAPWATLYTETIPKTADSDRERFEELFCGATTTVSTLLGISPTEYWTNATAVASVNDYVMQAAAAAMSSKQQPPGVLWRFAWKSNKHLSGQTSTQPLKVKDTELVALIHSIYRTMFIGEHPSSLLSLSREKQLDAVMKLAYPKYHRGSLVAFIKRLLQLVDVDKASVCRQVLDKVASDSVPVFGSNFMQFLTVEMSRQGLYTEPWLSKQIRPLTGWNDIPPYVAVTIVVPPSQWKRFYRVATRTNTGFAVEGSLVGMRNGVVAWHNLFPDVQVAFGKIKAAGVRGSPEFSVEVEEDKRGWFGDSPMIASFHVPTAALQVDPKGTKVGLSLQHNPQTISVFKAPLQLGDLLTMYDADLDDGRHVYVTKYPPGQVGFPQYNSLHEDAPMGDNNDECRASFTVNLNASGEVSTMTGRLDILSDKGKRLLAGKASVDVQRVSPFVFEIQLGNRKAVFSNRKAVFTLTFPVPIKDGTKTRIAHTSSYVEVIAPLADPVSSPALDDFIYPSTLANAAHSSALGHPIPVPLSIPHVNLDTLPVLDISNKGGLSFLTNLASFTFSTRERKLRDQAGSSGLAASPRMNFKESLFTMFMLASGLQGRETGLFAISQPQKDGIHMLILVSALRLDGANGSVVLDAAVLPLTIGMIMGGELTEFLLVVQEAEICQITVDDDELILWKKTLPALVERCRDWSHTPKCEHARSGATVPLSTEPAQKVICSCGAGKLPPNFINLPEWDKAAKFATRLAISPTYAVPFVEDVINLEMMKGAGSAAPGATTRRCRGCGKTDAKGGGALKNCARCLKAQYCSAECEKKDWKKHKMECKEAEGHQKRDDPASSCSGVASPLARIGNSGNL